MPIDLSQVKWDAEPKTDLSQVKWDAAPQINLSQVKWDNSDTTPGGRVLGGVAAVADLPLSAPGFILQTISETAYGMEQEVMRGASPKDMQLSHKEIWQGAREFGEPFQAFQAPMHHLAEHFGGKKEYEESPPSKALAAVGGGLQKGSDWLERTTGMPSEFYQSVADDLLAGGAVKLPGYIMDRIKAPDYAAITSRLHGQLPTGTDKPPVVTPEEVALIAKALDKGIPESSKPILKESIKAAKSSKSALNPGEYISGKGEDDLDAYFNAEKMARVKELKDSNHARPEHAAPGETPPISAYEADIRHNLETQVQEAISDPDIKNTDRTISEPAKDLAAEKVVDSLKTAAVKRENGAQSGKAHPKLLVPLGMMAGGAVIGSAINENDPVLGALEGAGAAFAFRNLANFMMDSGVGSQAKEVFDAVKPSLSHERKAATDVLYARTANMAASVRTGNALKRVWDNSISENRRMELTMLIQQGRYDLMNPTEKYLIKRTQELYDKLGEEGMMTGTLPRLIAKDFVPQFWDFKNPKTKAYFDDVGAEGGNASDFTIHSLTRGIDSYLRGMAEHDLKPVTLDYSKLLGMYVNSVAKAIENAKAVSALKALDMGNGAHAIEPTGSTMPRDYVTKHGIEALEGNGIHPEAVNGVQMAFDAYHPGLIQRGLLNLSFIAKRLLTTYSSFHTSALTMGLTGAGGNPVGYLAGAAARGAERMSGITPKGAAMMATGAAAGYYLGNGDISKTLLGALLGFEGAGEIGRGKPRISIPYKSGVDRALEEYYTGGPGDSTDWIIRNGFGGHDSIEDAHGRQFFDKVTNVIDTALGSKIHGMELFGNVDKSIHKFTFGYTRMGMKLLVAKTKFEREIINPKNAGEDFNEIAADVNSFTNNIFGGQDIQRLVERMKSRAGRAIAGSATSKLGLNVAQIVSFAPDWLVSTIRSWTQAVPGITETARTGRLARQYIALSAMYTLAISDMINLQTSGHHIWENDKRSPTEKKKGHPTWQDQLYSMTFIDHGDGTWTQTNKHFNEFIHLITRPQEFVENKLSTVITDPVNLLSNHQYMNSLSGRYAPPITTKKHTSGKLLDKTEWELEHHLPISVQQIEKGTSSGTFGFPTSGMTEKQKRELREKEKRERDHDR